MCIRDGNKQAKYKLAAEALAAGRTIPAELFNDPEEQQIFQVVEEMPEFPGGMAAVSYTHLMPINWLHV